MALLRRCLGQEKSVGRAEGSVHYNMIRNGGQLGNWAPGEHSYDLLQGLLQDLASEGSKWRRLH